MEIIVATGNKDKVREFREIFEGTDVRVVSMKEAGLFHEVEETGRTFAENALIKARALGKQAHAVVAADDSGLVIDALGGAPGVYSSRFLGEDTPYAVKNAKILDLMKNVPEARRTCRFVCAMAAVFPDGTECTAEAAFEGHVAYRSAGSHGFGYDPIFFLPGYGKTSAELLPKEKNAISHRGKALRMLKEKIDAWAACQ